MLAVIWSNRKGDSNHPINQQYVGPLQYLSQVAGNPTGMHVLSVVDIRLAVLLLNLRPLFTVYHLYLLVEPLLQKEAPAPEENVEAMALYQHLLGGTSMSHEAKQLLHTQYHKREKTVSMQLNNW